MFNWRNTLFSILLRVIEFFSIVKCGNQLKVITVRNSSCEKVMFSQASVILFTGGSTPPSFADSLPPESATAADGTHPTGMHSCLFYIFRQKAFVQM